MTARDVITLARENLRDTKEPYRYSDSLLLSFLNQHQNHISRTFELPISAFRKEMTPRDCDVLLPTSSLKILKAFFNTKPLKIYSIESLSEPKRSELYLLFLDMQVFSLSQAREGLLELFYIPATPAQNLDSTLALSDVFVDLLTYYVCKRAFQIEANAQNLQRVQLYDALIKGEEDRIARIVSGNNSNTITTPYRAV